MVEKTEDWAISSRAPEMVKVQRPAERRRAKWPEVPSPSQEGEDMVCSAQKYAAARKGGLVGNAIKRTTGTARIRFSRSNLPTVPCIAVSYEKGEVYELRAMRQGAGGAANEVL